MKTRKMMQTDLDTVLLGFRAEAGAPNPSFLDAYCRRYPQFARELTEYAVDWLIDDAVAQEEASVKNAPLDEDLSNRLVSRGISRLYEKMQERDQAESVVARQTPQVSNPFEGLSLVRVRSVRDELDIDTPLFAKFRNRLIDPRTVPRPFLERFANLIDKKVEEFFAYLSLPAMAHADSDFKSISKPSAGVTKETFEEAVRNSSLEEARKHSLLND